MSCILDGGKSTTTTLLKCCHLKAKIKYNYSDVLIQPKPAKMSKWEMVHNSAKVGSKIQQCTVVAWLSRTKCINV